MWGKESVKQEEGRRGREFMGEVKSRAGRVKENGRRYGRRDE